MVSDDNDVELLSVTLHRADDGSLGLLVEYEGGLPVVAAPAPGGLVTGDVITAIDGVTSVSYTHLTLPARPSQNRPTEMLPILRWRCSCKRKRRLPPPPAAASPGRATTTTSSCSA